MTYSLFSKQWTLKQTERVRHLWCALMSHNDRRGRRGSPVRPAYIVIIGAVGLWGLNAAPFDIATSITYQSNLCGSYYTPYKLETRGRTYWSCRKAFTEIKCLAGLDRDVAYINSTVTTVENVAYRRAVIHTGNPRVTLPLKVDTLPSPLKPSGLASSIADAAAYASKLDTLEKACNHMFAAESALLTATNQAAAAASATQPCTSIPCTTPGVAVTAALPTDVTSPYNVGCTMRRQDSNVSNYARLDCTFFINAYTNQDVTPQTISTNSAGLDVFLSPTTYDCGIKKAKWEGGDEILATTSLGANPTTTNLTANYKSNYLGNLFIPGSTTVADTNLAVVGISGFITNVPTNYIYACQHSTITIQCTSNVDQIKNPFNSVLTDTFNLSFNGGAGGPTSINCY